jgi:hypothetical protein
MIGRRLGNDQILLLKIKQHKTKSEGLCDSLPWEGVGRGFYTMLSEHVRRTNPSLPLLSPAAPLPREGIKKETQVQASTLEP